MKHSRDDLSVLEPSMEEAVEELIAGAHGLQHAGTGSDDSRSELQEDEFEGKGVADVGDNSSEESGEEMGAHESHLMYGSSHSHCCV